MTSCSPSVKGPSNGPVNHLTGNSSWKGCLFRILEDSVNLLKGPLAIVRCHPQDVPPLSVMHEAYPLHGVCIWPDLLQQSSQGREPREARTRNASIAFAACPRSLFSMYWLSLYTEAKFTCNCFFRVIMLNK